MNDVPSLVELAAAGGAQLPDFCVGLLHALADGHDFLETFFNGFKVSSLTLGRAVRGVCFDEHVWILSQLAAASIGNFGFAPATKKIWLFAVFSETELAQPAADCFWTQAGGESGLSRSDCGN